LNHDGVLDRHEIKTMMKDLLGRAPPDFVVDDMIASIDDDENGVIDIGEFSYLLATAERDQRW
jgi:Ca2+-binding EF-hand superfamily protein